MAWYYKDGDQEIGPVDKAELQKLVKAKKVGPKTLVRSEQMDEWQPLANMVRPKTKTAPPPPAPPKEASRKETPPEKAPVDAASTNPADEEDLVATLPEVVMGETSDEQGAPAAIAVCSQCGRSFPQDQMISYDDHVICAACKPIFVQKLKEGASLPTAMVYGGFWIRLVAKFIDGIIMTIVQWAIMIPVGMMFMPSMVENPEQFPPAGYFAFAGFQTFLGILLPVGYNTFFIGRFGASLGKMACQLRVVTPEGESVTYMRAMGRSFSEIISSLILAIGYIMAAFDDEKRTLHDRIASTRVVRK